MTSKKSTDDKNCSKWPLSQKLIKKSFQDKKNPEFQQLSWKSIGPSTFRRNVTQQKTPQTLQDYAFIALEHCFGQGFATFSDMVRKWLSLEWKEMRMKIQSRLTKIKYLQPTLICQGYSTIQKEIRSQWKKNNLLKGLFFLWKHNFKTIKFHKLSQVETYFNNFTILFTNLSYYLYSQCFGILVRNGMDIQLKLRRQTSVSIITQSSQWCDIYNKVVYPYLCINHNPFSQNFNLQTLGVNPSILDIYSSNHIFKNTGISLQKITKAITVEQFVLHLKEFRQNLLKQVQESIQHLEKKSDRRKHLTVEKEDILGCIAYILVTHRIDDIGVTLDYFGMMLGNDIDQVMRSCKVDCFRADLEAAVWLVTHPMVNIELPDDLKHK